VLRVAEAVARTDTGRQRSGNEDAAFAHAPLFVVADGMGGARGGEVASRLAIEVFERGLGDGKAEGIDVRQRLITRVQEANARIYDRALREQELHGMGTTLTAAYLEAESVALAHVGDSRAYLLRSGELARLTEDHSLVSELVRHGKLTEEQAAEHPQRSIITRALGPEPTVEVDTWSYPASAGDVVLLCSDGLTSMLSEERIAEIVTRGPSLTTAAERLIAEANAAGGRDNITVVLFRLEDAAGAPVDQPTEAISAPQASGTGQPEPVPPPAAATAADPRTAAASSVALADRPRPRLARTQGPPRPAEPQRRRRSERQIKLFSGVIAAVIVVGLLAAGGYLATRELYFVSTDSRAMVTIYRGLPFELPFGIRLYETYYRSGVPAALVPPDRRSALFNDDLRSQNSAQNLVMALERGEISR
jgi:serine/threonine protein phosphatase PrpC